MKKALITLLFASIILTINNFKAHAMGLIYTNANYPVTATGASSGDLRDLKKGISTSINILGLVEFGDSGINKAAVDGNVKTIQYIDVNEKSMFIFFRKITTTVYGE